MAKKKKVADSQEESDIKKEIKEMERKKREEALKKAPAVVAAPTEKEVSFDEWYIMRASAIPAVHRKEVLRADFKGRGLKGKASLARFDEALAKYGVKLKK